jgi:hypothetical protein
MKKTLPIHAGRRLYEFFSSIQLCIILLLFLTLDLGIGYFCVSRHNILFEPMNRTGLFPWLATYGRANLTFTAWFFLFLPILALLVVNTLVCTTGKLIHLFSRRKQNFPGRRAKLCLSIHTMHLGLIILLFGYLISYTMATVYPAITLLPGKERIIAGTGISLELLEVIPDFYTGTRLAAFAGRSVNPRAEIMIRDSRKKRETTIAFNRPVWLGKYTVFLSRFSPKSAKTMNPTGYIVVNVRRDPGVTLYFSGLAVFLCGMAGYQFFKKNSPKKVHLI